jgi:hypothetical protein
MRTFTCRSTFLYGSPPPFRDGILIVAFVNTFRHRPSTRCDNSAGDRRNGRADEPSQQLFSHNDSRTVKLFRKDSCGSGASVHYAETGRGTAGPCRRYCGPAGAKGISDDSSQDGAGRQAHARAALSRLSYISTCTFFLVDWRRRTCSDSDPVDGSESVSGDTALFRI